MQPPSIHPKVAGAGVSSSVAIIILWAVSPWVDVPPEVAGAFASLLAVVGGWLTPADAKGV